jgi:hypothetical protein
VGALAAAGMQVGALVAPIAVPIVTNYQDLITELAETEPAQRAAKLPQLAASLQEATKYAWTFSTSRVAEGGAMIAGKMGEALVVDGIGQVFRGNINAIGHFVADTVTPGAVLAPVYENLRLLFK